MPDDRDGLANITGYVHVNTESRLYKSAVQISLPDDRINCEIEWQATAVARRGRRQPIAGRQPARPTSGNLILAAARSRPAAARGQQAARPGL